MKPASLALLLTFALVDETNAATIHVPADQPTIQAAIDAAVHGDTVLVAPGTYNEAIDFHGKIITVTSEQGAAATVIDAGGLPTVVTFKSGETRNAILSGFTITGGRTIYSGAGISVSFSSPTIRENIIAGNSGCSGVGVYSYFSSPRIENNTIARNIISGCTGGWGIGIYIGGNSAAEIIGNVITDNRGAAASGGGIALFAAGSAVVTSNIIARNVTEGTAGCGWGGGVAIANFVEAKIVNNLIVHNSACYGGAFYWYGSSGNTLLVNNTIADNDAQTPGIHAIGVDARNQLYNNILGARFGPALYCENGPSVTPPTLDSNDVFSLQAQAYAGTCLDQTGVTGNISADPQFLDADAGDFRVGISSPVVDAGNNWVAELPMTDLAGNPRISGAGGNPDRIDIGAYEYFNRAPMVDAGVDQTVTLLEGCFASVTLDGVAFDEDGDQLTFTWTSSVGTFSGPSPTISLPAGSYVFTLTVTDGNGGTATDEVVVIVRDVTAPKISSVTASPSVLTSANHDMVPVVVTPSASDSCGATVTCRIVSVTSNEPTSGLGGGDVGPNDWEITGALTVSLRAERWHKGTGRTYTITVECRDPSGNLSWSTVTVTVPRK